MSGAQEEIGREGCSFCLGSRDGLWKSPGHLTADMLNFGLGFKDRGLDPQHSRCLIFWTGDLMWASSTSSNRGKWIPKLRTISIGHLGCALQKFSRLTLSGHTVAVAFYIFVASHCPSVSSSQLLHRRIAPRGQLLHTKRIYQAFWHFLRDRLNQRYRATAILLKE